jgi:hypothetical protein
MSTTVARITGTPYTVPTITGTPTATVSTADTAGINKITVGTGNISVTSNGGSAITGYNIYLYKSGNYVNTTYTTSISSYVLNVTDFGSHTISIKAVNAAGESNESTKSSSVTVWAVPTFTSITYSYTPDFGQTYGTLSVSFAWSLNGNTSLSGLSLMYSNGTQFGNAQTVNTSENTNRASTESYAIDNNIITLGTSTNLYFRPVFLRSSTTYNALITDSTTYLLTNVILKNKPASITLPTFTKESATTFNITGFTAPNDGGDPITDYVIYAMTTTNGSSFSTANVRKKYPATSVFEDATFTISDIDTSYSTRTHKKYKFRMRALNSISTISDESTPPGTVTSYTITFT